MIKRFGPILALLSISSTFAFAASNPIEETCKSRLQAEFARTSYGVDEKGKYELQKTQVQIVDDIPVEAEIQQIALTALYVQAVAEGEHQYTFLIKHDLCLPENAIDLESLVRFRIAEHYATIKAQLNTDFQKASKASLNTFKNIQSAEQLKKEYLDERLKFDPGAAAVKGQINRFAKIKLRAVVDSGFIKNELKIPSADDVQDGVRKRIMDSIKQADGTYSYGSFWQNPNPDSITYGQQVELHAIIDSLALLFGNDKLPDFWKERLLIETDTDATFYNGGNNAISQMSTIKFKVGDSYAFFRDSISDFTEKRPNDCNGDSHCLMTQFKSFGFRWNARDPLKYRSNAYFEYELIKWNGNHDFEVNTIAQTAAANPHWPMLRRMTPPPPDNPGLLLGYIIRTGFIAQVADKVPQFIPFLKKSYGKLEVFNEDILYGSTPGTDDADSMDIVFGFQIRHPNYITYGFKVMYSAEIDFKGDASQRRSVTTGMAFVTVPLKEPKYENEDFEEKQYSKKFEITNAGIFNKLATGKIPAHFNGDESEQKLMENGIDIAAAWGRFIYEAMISEVTTKSTSLVSNVPNYQNAIVSVKYELNPKLRLVAEGMGDNYREGHGQIGGGVQILPFKGTPAENLVNVSITGMAYPYSGYCAVARCNQVAQLAPDIAHNLQRNWSLVLEANKLIRLGRFSDWSGVKGEVGLRNLLYMHNFDYGYMSTVFNTGLIQENLGLRIGTAVYGQDFNFGSPAGVSPFAEALGGGQTGPHSDRGAYLTWDALKSWRHYHPTDEISTKLETPKENMFSETPEAKPKETLLQIDLNKIPSIDRQFDIVYGWLAEIQRIWYSKNQSPEAQKLYEMVPLLVAKIAEKDLWTAKFYLNLNKPLMAIRYLESVRRIYDPLQDYSKIELETDKSLDSFLRNSFAKDQEWTKAIKSLGTELFGETKYCLGVANQKAGDDAKAQNFLSDSSYQLPGFLTRQYRQTVHHERFCD